MVFNRELSEREIIIKLNREYTTAIQHDDKNFSRSVQNWRFYWGIDADRGLGQWPETAVQEFVRERRQLATFNMCQPTVDHVAGEMAKSPFSLSFSPVDSEVTSLTMMAKEALYSDKELCDWDIALLQMYINGGVYRADMEMYVNYEYDSKNGNIGLRCRIPGSVTYDPYWKTSRSKDCRKCWVSSWMTPAQMMESFPDKTAEIDKALWMHKNGKEMENALAQYYEMQQRLGDEYGDNRGIFPYSSTEDMWGSQFRVVQCYYMQSDKRKCEYAVVANGDDVKIPRDFKTVEEKIVWLNENHPEWEPDGVYEEYETDEIQYITSYVPALSDTLILSHGATKVQCGRLQFFPFSYHMNNGEFKGLIDGIKDAQEQINFLMANKMYSISVQGNGGPMFADEAGFDKGQLEDFIRNRANPRKVYKTKNGYIAQNGRAPVLPLISSPPNYDIDNYLSKLIDVMWPKISKVTPASQGESESSSESGYLFRLKKIQSEIQRYTIFASLQNWWNELGEAYLMQASIVYGNGVQRKIYNPKTKSAIIMNERILTPDGLEVIKNDMSKLREMRHKVIIREAQDAPTRRVETMMIASETMRVMPQTKTATISKLGTMIASSLDQLTEEEREEIVKLGQLEDEYAEETLRMNIAMAKQKTMEAELTIGKYNNQQNQAKQASAKQQGIPPAQVGGVEMASLAGDNVSDGMDEEQMVEETRQDMSQLPVTMA